MIATVARRHRDSLQRMASISPLLCVRPILLRPALQTIEMARINADRPHAIEGNVRDGISPNAGPLHQIRALLKHQRLAFHASKLQVHLSAHKGTDPLQFNGLSDVQNAMKVSEDSKGITHGHAINAGGSWLHIREGEKGRGSVGD